MKKTLKALAAFFVGGVMLTACNSNEPTEWSSPITFQSSDLVMGYGMDGTSPLYQVAAPQVIVTRSFSSETLQFTFNGLYTPQGAINFSSKPMPYTTTSYTEQGKLIISQPSVTMDNFVLTNFNFVGYGNWMSIQFQLDGLSYVINTLSTYNDLDIQSKIVLYNADTKVTGTPFDPSGFSTDTPQYAFAFKPSSKTVDLYIYGAKFASSMPELFICIPGLSYSMTETGYSIWQTGEIVPSTVDGTDQTPVPSYVITGLTANLPYSGSNGTVSFKCTTAEWLVEASNLEIALLQNSNGQ